ncbi:hypothetical protein GCWU000341_02037 [Oribacterium sp. oral taxon 078 str. F0262]|nr:hypothetical protein GCWU000341_02037 [Oribacterium sp. oral taxon 078 str. F0262]
MEIFPLSSSFREEALIGRIAFIRLLPTARDCFWHSAHSAA